MRFRIERLGLHLQGHWLTLVVITLHLERTAVSLRWQRNRRASERFAHQKEKETAMRDGRGNRLSPEEERKVKSIQGAPGKDSLKKVSINPVTDKDTGSAEKPDANPDEKTSRESRNYGF